ncbi:succinyldiaminopimelate transaminase [Homoserinimonas sp. OAct 916]|uniref:succinyldiaminopimelate transaminase n=1 Tax=Homoserinimonas sp. OAct 916 TaxID=2211450 RepID=UPI000DBE2C71|nr:succinyldiaminopimelate transaminase [Homoserinimonas sp. OAct 916]
MTPPRWSATLSNKLFPEFPWSHLAPLRKVAGSHPDGVVNMAIGAPVDPTPAIIRDALAKAADAPGYPAIAGTSELREAIVNYYSRKGVRCLDATMVLPTIGSKEAIGQLPAFLGLNSNDTITFPDIGYPTYEIGALAVGATPHRYSDPMEVDTENVAVFWINSPSNPEGRILDVAELRTLVSRARATKTLLVSDECYLDFGWDRPAVSILDSAVCDDDPTGLLVINSLSKRSNLAGYRAGFFAGDPTLIAALLDYRQHMGQMVPGPVQAAMTAALLDEDHVLVQRELYLDRLASIKPAVLAAGFTVKYSEGGLYLWLSRAGEDCWQIADWFARLGIVCVPGEIYGTSGRNHVRLSLTASDSAVAEATRRLRV